MNPDMIVPIKATNNAMTSDEGFLVGGTKSSDDSDPPFNIGPSTMNRLHLYLGDAAPDHYHTMGNHHICRHEITQSMPHRVIFAQAVSISFSRLLYNESSKMPHYGS
jgi:hypothetical protein